MELFAGSAAVFFCLEPSRAVLVDACNPLMAFYEAIKKRPDAVYDSLERLLALPFGEGSYNSVRSEFSGRGSGVDHAARLIYLNKLGFNGLFRLNKDLGYNVAWGKHDKMPGFPSRSDLVRASSILRNARLHSCDYSSVLRATKSGDVVYADPPYWGTYDRYAGGSFSDQDHRNLAGMLASAVSRGVTVFSSNIDCDGVRDAYGHWAKIDVIPVRHKISCTREGRKVVNEVLIFASRENAGAKQLSLF